jgi:hypothetical protein
MFVRVLISVDGLYAPAPISESPAGGREDNPRELRRLRHMQA